MKRFPPPSPNVAELSAPITTPSLQRMPTIAVTFSDSTLGPVYCPLLTRCLPANSGRELDLNKYLILLALPRGIEPLFQP